MLIFNVDKVLESESGEGILIGSTNFLPFKNELLFCDALEMHAIKYHKIKYDQKNKLDIIVVLTNKVASLFKQGQTWTSVKSINPESFDHDLLRIESKGHKFSPHETSDGELFGVLWCHPTREVADVPEGAAQCGDEFWAHCETMLQFEPGCHSIKNIEPMTFFPSLVCVNCGAHGWLENGKYHGGYDQYRGGVYPHMRDCG